MDDLVYCVLCGAEMEKKGLVIKNKAICDMCEKEIVDLRVSDAKYDEIKDRLKCLAR